MTDIGAKIGIDGEKQFRNELANITQAGKTLSAQMDTLTSSFGKNEKSEEDAAKVSKKLSEQIDNQQKLVDKLQEAVQRSSDKTGENSTQTLKWKEKLAKAETELSKFEHAADESGKEVEELGKEEDETSKKTSIFGDVLKANLASEAIKRGVQALAEAAKQVGKFFVDAIKGAAAYADEMLTLSKTTGLSTDALQEYQYMAALVDVDLGTITGSLTKLTKSMSSAKDGTGTQADAFAQLGVSVTDANGELRDSSEVFDDVLKALGGIDNETERDALAMDILGKSAKDLNPLIEAGADAMNDLRKEAHDVGAVLDKETLDALGEVQDGFDRLGGTWDAVKKKLGAKLGAKILPDLEKFVSLFQDLAKTGNVGQFVDKFIRQLTEERNWSNIGNKLGDILGRILANAPKLIMAGGKLVVGLIKGIVSGIPEMAQTILDELEKSRWTDRARDMVNDLTNIREEIESIPGAAERMSSSLADVNAKQSEAEHWIQIFDDLSKKTNPTAIETERLQTAVNKLNELYPELGLKLDSDTGKWSLNTEGIRNNIAALSEKYRAEAYYAAASDTLRDIAKLEAETRELRNQQDVLEFQKRSVEALIEADEKRVAAYEELNKKWSHGQIASEAYYEELSRLTGMEIDSVLDADKAYDKLRSDLNDHRNELNFEIMPVYDKLSDTIAVADEKIANLQGDVDFFWNKAAESTKKGGAVVANYSERLAEIMSTASGTVRKKAYAVGAALGDGVNAGLNSTAEKIAQTAASTVSNAIKRMKNVAQIHSPSKVTENLIGKNLALGVVEGWNDVFSGKRLRNTLSVEDAVRSIGTTNNTTNLGGVSVNVYAAEGQDANTIAQMVMMKMQGAVNSRRAVFSNELHI